MCCCPLVLSVGLFAPLAVCPVLNACPLPSTLCPLPHVTGLGWSCSVLPSFCPRHPVWFGCMVSACAAGPPLSAPASCHWPWVVLFGFTLSLSQTSGVVLWHGLSMCCFGLLCFLLPFVALWQLALCPCMPSALHSVLSVCPCGVLPLLFHNLNCSLP